jgi:flagellar hook-basal body complex protein FliE
MQMFKSFIPKVDLPNMITNSKIDTNNPQPYRLSAAKTPESAFQNFSGVMQNLIKGLDAQTKVPDKIMAESMVNPEVDIHDVMLAVNQTELTLTVATSATTKIIQGYEKIISMQV